MIIYLAQSTGTNIKSLLLVANCARAFPSKISLDQPTAKDIKLLVFVFYANQRGKTIDSLENTKAKQLSTKCLGVLCYTGPMHE